jgi:hypothetical protein
MPEKKLLSKTRGNRTLTAVSKKVSVILNVKKHTSEIMKRCVILRLDME